MVTKEEFNKVWKDSTKEDILNQFYYEHIAIRKAIGYIKENITWYYDEDLDESVYQDEISGDKVLNILQNGSDEK